MRTKSPLRFPGSKSKVLYKLEKYLSINHVEYREPFFGGGSIFLGKRNARINWLNDKDPLIYDFFVAVRDRAVEFCLLIQKYGNPTIDRWIEFRNSPIPDDPLERAYRLLFFNRTNYSGIFNSNPIGGIKQDSEWKIDCRWNEKLICKRIIECSTKLKNTLITNMDFEEIITQPGNQVLLMLDPPYYGQGSKLYPVSMTREEHIKLANLLKETQHRFILTIDDNEKVREIYYHPDFYYYPTSWKYTVHSNKKDNNGKELFISNFPVEGAKKFPSDFFLLASEG